MSEAGAAGDPWLLESFRVVSKVRESADVVTFELEGRRSVDILPGQFNMLYAFGKGEVPISLSGHAAGELRLTHTIRDVGSITADLCSREPGDSIDLRGPYGSAWPLDAGEGRDVVIVAGGIGLAPVRPVVRALLDRRDRYRRVTLLYGARTPDDLIYSGELQAWRRRDDIDCRITVDVAPVDWQGSVGLVTNLFAELAFEPGESLVLTCGPEVMMRLTAETMMQLGVPAGRICLSMERNMKCAIGFCGHCLYGPQFICRDGPVFSYDRLRDLLPVREL